MAQAYLIRTPTDFETALAGAGDFSKVVLMSPDPRVEPRFRQALHEVFEDLPYVSGDHDLMPAYLEGIADPLDQLQGLGVGLFALVTKGTLTFPEGTLGQPGEKQVPWYRTYYLVIPANGLFRVGRETTGTVHRFSADCRTAVDLLAHALDQQEITVWATPGAVVSQLERSVPWCGDCCLDYKIQF